MKKKITYALLFAAIIMTGCGKSPDSTAEIPELTDVTVSDAEPSAEETAPLTEKTTKKKKKKASQKSDSGNNTRSPAVTTHAMTTSEAAQQKAPDNTVPAPADPDKEYPALPPLSDEDYLQICEDYAEYISDGEQSYDPEDIYIMKYYGSYNGCEAVTPAIIDMCYAEAVEELEIGGYTFFLPCLGLDLLIHEGSEFIDIRSAYDSGLIDEESLDMISYYSENTGTMSVNRRPEPPDSGSDDEPDGSAGDDKPYIEPLSAETEEELKAAFAEKMSGIWADSELEEIYVEEYFGTYGGCPAVIMWSLSMPGTCDIQYVDVGGYTFELASGSLRMCLYKGGEFIPIEEAYEKGYISDEDAASMYYCHTVH